MTSIALSSSKHVSRIKIGIAVVVLIAGVVWLVSLRLFSSWDLRHGLWSASYLLVREANPFGMDAPSQAVRSVWFPMAVGAFFPIGWLNQYEATNAWLLMTLVALGATVWIAGGLKRPTPVALGFSASVALLFPPVLSHLLLGQFTILAGMLFLLITYLIRRRRIVSSALLTALALTKPQLGFLALPGILIGFYRAGGIKCVAQFCLALAGSLAWLTLAVWLINPQFWNDMIDIAKGTPDFVQPSSFKMLQHSFGGTGIALWVLIAAGCMVVNFWLWCKFPPTTAMIWGLALTTLASPYAWSWDYVLLIPAMIYSFTRFKAGWSKFVLAGAYFICWIWMVAIRLNTDNSDDRFWWVPIFLLLALVVSHGISRVKSDSSHAND